MKFRHRQKRTGWLLIVVSGGYLVWFLKVRLLTAGLPIEKKEWLLFRRHDRDPDARHHQRPPRRDARAEAEVEQSNKKSA